MDIFNRFAECFLFGPIYLKTRQILHMTRRPFISSFPAQHFFAIPDGGCGRAKIRRISLPCPSNQSHILIV